MADTVRIQENVPLAPLCTLELGGRARYFAEVATEGELRLALARAREMCAPYFVLGGGSNVVVPDEGYAGLVIRIGLRGLSFEPGPAGAVRVTVGAGEPWDDVVAACLARGLQGLECLSGIPGTAGAVPVQNVGAYGQEVAETIESVRVLDPRTLESASLANAECEFAYRDSAFKQQRGRAAGAIVVAVTFVLRAGAPPAVRYPELANALAARPGAATDLAAVRETVIALRRGKSMVLDPADENRRSAGSFFTNPIVDIALADEVVARAVAGGLARSAADVPRYPAGPGRAKLAAAWLIERAGFRKGERRGPVGISSRHALALVHHGGGRSAELLAFADEIRAGVRATFGVELSLEPVVLR